MSEKKIYKVINKKNILYFDLSKNINKNNHYKKKYIDNFLNYLHLCDEDKKIFLGNFTQVEIPSINGTEQLEYYQLNSIDNIININTKEYEKELTDILNKYKDFITKYNNLDEMELIPIKIIEKNGELTINQPIESQDKVELIDKKSINNKLNYKKYFIGTIVFGIILGLSLLFYILPDPGYDTGDEVYKFKFINIIKYNSDDKYSLLVFLFLLFIALMVALIVTFIILETFNNNEVQDNYAKYKEIIDSYNKFISIKIVNKKLNVLKKQKKYICSLDNLQNTEPSKSSVE